jgi:hypothetical protein
MRLMARALRIWHEHLPKDDRDRYLVIDLLRELALRELDEKREARAEARRSSTGCAPWLARLLYASNARSASSSSDA